MAEGAEACVYFRWRPTLFAQEQYHSGLLRHDGEPAQGLHDVKILAAENKLMSLIAAEPSHARVALLFRYDDLWALELQPQRQGFHYLRHLYVYYMTLLKLGVAVNLVSDTADLSPYDLVLAPTLHMPDSALVDRLTRFVEEGGSLLLGVRSGFKTPSNLVTDLPLPGLLRNLAGVQITSWQSLPDGVGLAVDSTVPGLSGLATYWYETLTPETATILGSYKGHGPALAMNNVGQGRVYTLGWYPDPAQVRAFLEYLCREGNIAPLASFPEGVLVFERGPYVLLLNFTDQEQTVEVNSHRVHILARDIAVYFRDQDTKNPAM
jgi:beta-galactosidase